MHLLDFFTNCFTKSWVFLSWVIIAFMEASGTCEHAKSIFNRPILYPGRKIDISTNLRLSINGKDLGQHVNLFMKSEMQVHTSYTADICICAHILLVNAESFILWKFSPHTLHKMQSLHNLSLNDLWHFFLLVEPSKSHTILISPSFSVSQSLLWSYYPGLHPHTTT